eukprot:gene57124-biopygen19942
MVYEGGQIKALVEQFFQKRLTHPRENNPDWDREWNADGGPREQIIKTVRTGQTVDPGQFHEMREEDFEQGEARRLPGAEDGAATLLPKSGDSTYLTRTRGIGLRSHPHQIADGIHIETGRREITRVADQCLHGFMEGRLILEGQWEIRGWTEKMLREFIAWLWMATDVAKAYDELIREGITAAMEGLGCPIWWITHWERSWEGVRAHFRTPHGETGWVVWKRGMVQGIKSAPLQYVVVTIYVARAIKKEYPSIRQIWVADDGVFGATPEQAAPFLPFLRRTYRPLGLRMAQEKLEVYAINMQRKEEHRRMITIDLDTGAEATSTILQTTEETETVISVKDGALWIHALPNPGKALREVKYEYPFKLQWELVGNTKERQEMELPRQPAAFRRIMTELYSMGESVRWEDEQFEYNKTIRRSPPGTLFLLTEETAIFTGKDCTRRPLKKGSLVRMHNKKGDPYDKETVTVRTTGSEPKVEAILPTEILGPVTRVEIPQSIEGLMELDGVLIRIEEQTMAHMGSSLPMKGPAQMLPKTKAKINEIIQWYWEEKEQLPIMSLVWHGQSKVLGTLRTQFQAALLPTTEGKGGAEEEEQDDAGDAEAPKQIWNIAGLQKTINRAVGMRTKLENVANVNRAWMYCPLPIGLGVPDLVKEQAATFLGALTKLNGTDAHSWDPAWGSIQHEFKAEEICSQVTLPVYHNRLPRQKKDKLAGHIIKASQELEVAIFFN